MIVSEERIRALHYYRTAASGALLHIWPVCGCMCSGETFTLSSPSVSSPPSPGLSAAVAVSFSKVGMTSFAMSKNSL